jgi:phage tail-like protein
MSASPGFLYANEANAWPRFELHGIEITAAGSLGLAAASGGTLARRGVFRAGPFEAQGDSTPWCRVRAEAEAISDSRYVELFTATGDAGSPAYDPDADVPFAASDWKRVPRNVLDAWVLNPPAGQLWLGGVVRGDGQRSPLVHQIRIEYGRNTWLRFLPAIYGNDAARRDLLERFLSLHESVLGELEDSIARLPQLFDPQGAPYGEFPSWLSWLAGWLAFDLDAAWSEPDARRYLAGAFELFGKRGTVEGLRRFLEMYAGVHARITELAAHNDPWSLGDKSVLGFSTRLASAHAQGAVLGATATLGQSHLTRADELGAALFDDVAHRFCVHVYAAELDRPGALEDVRAVIEREKPAQSEYDLCVIDARLRVGVQASVGVDTIIAAASLPMRLGMQLDGVTLAQTAAPCDAKEEP